MPPLYEPAVQEAIDGITRIQSQHRILSIESARAYYLALNALSAPPEEVAEVEERLVPGPGGLIPIRIYRPRVGERLPAVVYFHGGWFFLGGLDTHDSIVRALANAAGCTVIAVDYRLAPEHPFPAAPNDCFAATAWTYENAAQLGIDPERIAVVGDSVGGALTAVVARQARDLTGPPLAFQGMIYPLTDSSFDSPSWREFGSGPLIGHSQALLARMMYTPDRADYVNSDAFPLNASDLHGLPPALVITAELDPLRDEGESYAEALQVAGGQVTLSRYPGMIHGFVQMGGILDTARQAIDEMAAALDQAFRGIWSGHETSVH